MSKINKYKSKIEKQSKGNEQNAIRDKCSSKVMGMLMQLPLYSDNISNDLTWNIHVNEILNKAPDNGVAIVRRYARAYLHERMSKINKYKSKIEKQSKGNEQNAIRDKCSSKVMGMLMQLPLYSDNISNDLTWNIHVNEILNKAPKRLYFWVQLKRAKVTRTDLGLFYSSCIISIMDYAVPAFHFSLPKYLMQELERIQKRAMSIICRVSDHEALVIMNFRELATHHDEICDSLFHINDNNQL